MTSNGQNHEAIDRPGMLRLVGGYEQDPSLMDDEPRDSELLDEVVFVAEDTGLGGTSTGGTLYSVEVGE
jgi:hypothetical protein